MDKCLDPVMKAEVKWRWLEGGKESEPTAMGFFTISKSSMISAYFCTMLGYLIVLIQFNMADVSVNPCKA